jgi:hypothetical protein
MTNATQIRSVLSRLAAILHSCGNNNWAATLETFDSEMLSDPAGTAARITGIFGGMGSFNDVVLYRGGQVAHGENEELDRLRTELYALCRE